jgi:oligoendopeptidase F
MKKDRLPPFRPFPRRLGSYSFLSDAMTAITPVFPDRWSLESWFSGFGLPDYLEFKESIRPAAEELQARAQRQTGDVEGIAGLLRDLETFEGRLGLLGAYLGCLSADNADDELVKADEAWFSTMEAEYTKVCAAVQATLAGMESRDFDLLLKHPLLEGGEYAVGRMRESGNRQMRTDLEALAADLNVNGLHAWGRLYDTLTGKMTFEMTFPDGRVETVPMARRRALLAEPDRRVRESAFHAGQKPWHEHEVTLAAALNGIAGTRLSLYGRRGIAHFLDTPLFDAGMERASLDAMLEAIRTNVELPRRALRKAAQLQGTGRLHYFDLEAPQVAAPEAKPLGWSEACSTVEEAFGCAYPGLGAYFREMLDRRWIEAQPRAGKRPGAFCTGSHLRREERIYMTFHETVHDMVTLAHEAGHAWHSRVLRPARGFASNYPMTLAETASNFGEMILLSGLLGDPGISAETKAYLLDQEMLRAHAYLVNIPMRYEFEKAFYTERASGEVSVTRLGELMSTAQRDLYGDTLFEDGTDPLFWAYKMHFFITGVSFYNFPYVFGYLLSQALFARFRTEGAAFLPHYEAFLALTGSASCEEAVKRTLGEDLRDPAFWARAVCSMREPLEAYEKLSTPGA